MVGNAHHTYHPSYSVSYDVINAWTYASEPIKANDSSHSVLFSRRGSNELNVPATTCGFPPPSRGGDGLPTSPRGRDDLPTSSQWNRCAFPQTNYKLYRVHPTNVYSSTCYYFLRCSITVKYFFVRVSRVCKELSSYVLLLLPRFS